MSLVFRNVKEGSQNAQWVKELKGKSGVYVIREKAHPIVAFFEMAEILYIGESHTGNIKKTLLRHFQRWKGKTAGATFDPAKVEVAIVRCPANRALNLQNSMIEEFRPKLNIAANPDAE